MRNIATLNVWRAATMAMVMAFCAVSFAANAQTESASGKWSYGDAADSSKNSATASASTAGVSQASDYQADDQTDLANQTRHSEFNNTELGYVKDWRQATPRSEYEDTEFGELMYNESSVATKLEILRLISKDTPSLMVFMTAVSMGLNIETVLQAAVSYDPDRSRDFAAAAVNIVPILNSSTSYLFSDYELDDLERESSADPYSVEEVIERFFEDRQVLRPFPDWFEGQYHFLASAAELKRLQNPQKTKRWYKTKSTQGTDNRPIFISLYEANQSVLIDGDRRIATALAEDPDARLPVVFVFNRLNERSIDELEYPKTIRGVQNAYTERNLMVTPTPEWELGEYHIYAQIEEFYEVFNIPEEDDFEPEAWQKLLKEAEDYTVTNTSFLLVIVGSPDNKDDSRASLQPSPLFLAAWDDPRTEQAFPYTAADDGPPVTLKNLIGQGIVFSRSDLIAALNTLGVTQVPVVFYYIDRNRVSPYIKDPRALIAAALGAGAPIGTMGFSGGTPPPPNVCASPPCTEQ